MSCVCEVERGLARPSAARRRRTNVAVLVASLTCAIGCVPSVTHSPRVEPGPAMDVAVEFGGIVDTMPGWPPFVFPPSSDGLAYGWRDTSLDMGLRIGAGVSVFIAFEADVYLQLPRRLLLGLDGGVG